MHLPDLRVRGLGKRYNVIAVREIPGLRMKARVNAPQGFALVDLHPGTNEVDRRIATLHAHLHRQDLNPIEVVHSVAWLLRQPSVACQADLARRLDRSEVWVSHTLAILRLSDDLLHKVWLTTVPIAIDALSRIARLNNAIWQEELIDALLAGKSEGFIRRRIAQLKGEDSSGGKRFKADYKTCHQSAVVIRSRFKRLTPAQEREVLLDALAQLTKRSELEETRALA